MVKRALFQTLKRVETRFNFYKSYRRAEVGDRLWFLEATDADAMIRVYGFYNCYQKSFKQKRQIPLERSAFFKNSLIKSFNHGIWRLKGNLRVGLYSRFF